MSEEVNVVPVAESDASDLEDTYLTFFIEDVLYAVSLVNVIEIIGVEKITTVPGVPGYIKGIINLRGKIAPVLDARLKIGICEKEYDEKTCIIVINWHDSTVGLIVDSVSAVENLGDKEQASLPDFSNINTNRYLSSVCRKGDNLVLIFDCDKLLADESELAGML